MLEHTLAVADGMSREQRPLINSPAPVVTRLGFTSGATAPGRDVMLAVSAMSFGPFHILPSQRLLLEGDRPLRLGSRAFDILVVLIERAGELVSKDELRNLVWPIPLSKMATSKSRSAH